MADKLVVTGLGKQIDGEYEFSLAGMLTLGNPECLTNGEGHIIKSMSGVRAGELEDALVSGDNDVLIALGKIVLARNGKRVDDSLLWNAPMGAGMMIVPSSDPNEDEPEDDARPPEKSKGSKKLSESPETSGGESSSPQ